MIFSLQGPNYTRVASPVNLEREAREFLRLHGGIVESGFLATIVLDRTPGAESIAVLLLDSDRTRGWVIEMDTFGVPASFRKAGRADLELPVASERDMPLVLLVRLDGTTVPLESLDRSARSFLKGREPTFETRGKPRVIRIFFENEAQDSVKYMEPGTTRGMAVRFDRDGTPVAHQADEWEPD
ncbi:hypothetical protein AB1L88_17245 [Tautonia sp. JC769]|uniref:hypothetical protein n=1 Tax=Tautonia sp. JC769 TaxID=3232135 RepID=UPI003458159C